MRTRKTVKRFARNLRGHVSVTRRFYEGEVIRLENRLIEVKRELDQKCAALRAAEDPATLNDQVDFLWKMRWSIEGSLRECRMFLKGLDCGVQAAKDVYDHITDPFLRHFQYNEGTSVFNYKINI